MGSGSSVSKKPKSKIPFRRGVVVCPFDGKPCSQIILGAPACAGVETFGVIGEKITVEPCSRFPKGKR